MGQLPNEVAPNAFPIGNLDVSAIKPKDQAFPADVRFMQKTIEFAHGESKVPVAENLVSAKAVPVYGYIDTLGYGSFQITRSSAEGMFMLSSKLPFPDSRRSVDFYHAMLKLTGSYVEPGTGLTGFIYETELGPPINEKRYFFFGDTDIGKDPNSNGIRKIIYYDKSGRKLYDSNARFYRP